MIIVPDEVVNKFVEHGVDAAFAGALRPPAAGRAADSGHLDIIVPIFNAPEPTRECVRRVLKHSPPNCSIWLVDDASTDSAITQISSEASGDSRVKVIGRPTNLGYVASVNDVLVKTDGDVIVLNSDTEVTRDWCRKLQEAAAGGDVGIVCPVSDNATILSVISPVAVQERGSDAVAQQMEALGGEAFPEIPVAVGFCMLIRRAVVDRIGLFDPVFGAGYGEEVDYSLRAWRAGFRIVAATHCFVRHVGGQSFGLRADTGLLRRYAECVINRRWPGYVQWVQDWWRDSPLRVGSERLRHAVKNDPRSRFLHVFHRMDYLGGTEGITRALVSSVHAEFPSTLAAMSTRELGWQDILERPGGGGVDRLELNRRFRPVNQRLVTLGADLSHPWVERAFARLLLGGEYALVHFHHLVNWDSLLLPLIASRVGARVVISLHDLYFLCPDYVQMKTPGFRSCGKDRAIAESDCEPCLEARRWVRPDMEKPSLGVYLETRHALLRHVLDVANLITAPSEFSARRLRTAFGDTVADKIAVIPHGIDVSGQPAEKEEHEPLVIGYFGGTVPHKGFDLVCEVANGLKDVEVEFRVFGPVTSQRVPTDLPPRVRLLGRYQPAQMPELLAQVDVALIPSKIEETFSLILSEAWACGVPVIAANSGAMAERVSDGVDGWLMDPHAPRAWLEKLRGLATYEGRQALRAMRDHILAKERRSSAEMAQDYMVEYRRVLERPTDTSPALPAPVDVVALSGSAETLRRADQVRPLPVPPAPPSASVRAGPRLSAVVFMDESNRFWLENTIESLRCHVEPVEIFVVSDGPGVDGVGSDVSVVPDLRSVLEHGSGDWFLLLSSGDRMRPVARPWLALCMESGAELVYFDHVHLSVEGYTYEPVTMPPPDRVFGLQCPFPTSGCVVSAGLLHRLPETGVPAEMASVALSLWVARENSKSHHLPVPVFERLDVNSAGLARRVAAVTAIAQQLLGETYLVAAGSEGWQVTPRIHGAPPASVIAIYGQAAQVEETLSPLAASAPRNTLVTSAAKILEQPELVADCEYILHLPAGTRFQGEGWFDVLRAWAVHSGAAVVAPRLLGPGSNPLPMGYRFNLFGNARLVRDPAGGAGGLGPADWFAGNRSTLAVLPQCVLLKRDLLDGDVWLKWAELDPTAQLDIQAGLMGQGGEVLWIRDVVAELPSNEIGPEEISIQAKHCRLARDRRWFQPELHTTRPRSDHQLAGTRATRSCIAGSARNRWAAAQYRVDNPLSFLQDEGCIEAPLIWRTGNESPPSVFELSSAGADALMAHNFISDPALDRLKDYRHMGIPVIASLDDLLTDVPDYNTFSRTYPDIKVRLKRALSRCDRLIVSTQVLANFMSEFCADIVVVPNALPVSPWFDKAIPQRTDRQDVDRDRLRAGWVGAGQHAGDLEDFARVVERTSEQVDWVFCGMCPERLRPWVKEVHPMVPFENYPERLRELDLDFGVAPLLDNAFNRCKSHIKLLEYGAVGIPAIASDLDPYQRTPAVLARNEDDWVARILSYANDRTALARDGERLREWVKAEHLMPHRKALWLKALNLE